MADSSVNTGASGAPIRVLTALGTGSADQQVVTLADSAGNLLGTTAAPVPLGRYDTTATGSLTANGQTVTVATANGVGIVGAHITGTWSSNLLFEASTDGTNYVTVYALSAGGLPANLTTSNGLYQINAGGYVSVRVRSSAFVSGTVVVTLVASSANTVVALSEPLPTGGNTIGAVTGTFWQATQPVSLATAPTTPVTGTFWQATQPVSPPPTTLVVTGTAAVTTALTITLPAAGAGLFHYITEIDFILYSSAARTGAAAPTVVTSTNIPGSLAWTFTTAGAIGTSESQTYRAVTPLKSSVANTATTVVAPASTGGIWRITASYYAAT